MNPPICDAHFLIREMGFDGSFALYWLWSVAKAEYYLKESLDYFISAIEDDPIVWTPMFGGES